MPLDLIALQKYNPNPQFINWRSISQCYSGGEDEMLDDLLWGHELPKEYHVNLMEYARPEALYTHALRRLVGYLREGKTIKIEIG